MKKLLRSMLSVSIVLLLANSCQNEDELTRIVKDVDFSAPNDIDIQPGYERAVVNWRATPDPEIKSCVLYYADKEVKVKLTDSLMSYEIAELPEGEFTVAISNADKYGNESEQSAPQSAMIYGEEYCSQLAPRDIDKVSFLESGGVIEWSEATEDCSRVELTYTTTDGEEFTVNVSPASESTMYSNAAAKSDFTYVTYYRPFGGLDEVSVESQDEVSFPEYQLPAPENVSSEAGWNRALVTYTIPKNPSIAKVIFYDGNKEVLTKEVSALTALYDEVQELELESGQHRLYIAFADAQGGSLSELVLAGNKRVYDETYNLGDRVTRELILAEFSAEDATVTEGVLSLYLKTLEGCEQTQIYYDGEVVGEIPAAEMSIRIPEIKAATRYSYATLYYPYEGALDPIPAPKVEVVVPAAELRKEDENGNPTYGAMFLKGDIASYNYGKDDAYLYTMSQMWDGDKINTFYHSDYFKSEDESGHKYGTATFDLGATMKITHFKLYPRSRYVFTHNMPKYFKMYGAKEITPAMKEAGTEDTPSFEGWTQLGDVSTSYCYDSETGMYYGYTPSGEATPTSNDSSIVGSQGQIFNVDLDLGEFRYLRIQVFETWGNRVAFQIGEFCTYGVVSEEATEYDLYDYRDYERK